MPATPKPTKDECIGRLLIWIGEVAKPIRQHMTYTPEMPEPFEETCPYPIYRDLPSITVQSKELNLLWRSESLEALYCLGRAIEAGSGIVPVIDKIIIEYRDFFDPKYSLFDGTIIPEKVFQSFENKLQEGVQILTDLKEYYSD